jgi:hypothetical protein
LEKIAHDTGYWELVCGAKETQFSLFCSFTITLFGAGGVPC